MEIDETDEDAVDEELARLNVLLKMFRGGSVEHYKDGPGYLLNTWALYESGWEGDSVVYETLSELEAEIKRITTASAMRE